MSKHLLAKPDLIGSTRAGLSVKQRAQPGRVMCYHRIVSHCKPEEAEGA